MHSARPPDQRASFTVLSLRGERSVARALLLEAILQRLLPIKKRQSDRAQVRRAILDTTLLNMSTLVQR